MNPIQLNELNDWITKEISIHPYAQIDITLQVRNGAVVHLRRGSAESIHLDTGSTGSQKNDKSRY